MLMDPTAPSLVTVDVPRDWLAFWISTVGVVASIAIGGVALWVAMRANQHTKDAERRSREFAQRERQRVFELEVLRDLLAAVDNNTAISADQRARLAVFKPDELLVWRKFHEMIESDPQPTDYEVARAVVQAFAPELVLPSPTPYTRELRALFLADVAESIETRIQAADSAA